MLVLERKLGEAIRIGTQGEIVITVAGIDGAKVRLGIKADPAVPVYRQELLGPDGKPRPECLKRWAEKEKGRKGRNKRKTNFRPSSTGGAEQKTQAGTPQTPVPETPNP